jgi:hypothetical protein
VLPRWHLYATAAIVGLIFFITEHDLSVSLADAFTQTADEMEVTAEGGNIVRRLAFPMFGALGLVLLFVARQPVRINLLLALPITAYLLLAVGSVLWTDDRGLTLRRLIVLGCCTLDAWG